MARHVLGTRHLSAPHPHSLCPPAIPRVPTRIKPYDDWCNPSRFDAEERENRCRNGLCPYCGKPGHPIAACLAKNKQPLGKAHVQSLYRGAWIGCSDSPLYRVATTNSDLNEHHVTLDLSLCIPNMPPISASALVDSGASGNFMDIRFAQTNGIPTRRKPVPQKIETIETVSS